MIGQLEFEITQVYRNVMNGLTIRFERNRNLKRVTHVAVEPSQLLENLVRPLCKPRTVDSHYSRLSHLPMESAVGGLQRMFDR